MGCGDWGCSGGGTNAPVQSRSASSYAACLRNAGSKDSQRLVLKNVIGL
jgi:hypothetical protein